MNENICLICLENISDEEEVIEYNHCGKYYVHNKCLNNWSENECIICRKKYTDIVYGNSNENNENNENNESNESNESNNQSNINTMINIPGQDINNSCKYKILKCAGIIIVLNILLIGIHLFFINKDNEYNEYNEHNGHNHNMNYVIH